MAAPAATAARPGVNFTEWNSRGELLRLIAILVVPVAASNVLQSLIGFVDTRMCSILGVSALSAMSLGRATLFLVLSVFMGVSVGVAAYVSRLTGAGEHALARSYASLGLVVGAICGFALMALGYLIGPGPIGRMVAAGHASMETVQHAEAERMAWEFLSVIFLGLVFMGVQFAAVSIFNALGKTVFPMWLLVISNIVNLAGNWLFIPGPGIEPLRAALHLPAMGVAGSALATGLTNMAAMTVALLWLKRVGAIRFNFLAIPHPVAKAWDMLRIGLPVTLQMGARSISMLILLKIITYLPDSTIGQSALQVGIQVESLAFMPAFAFSTAAATLVGQNLGAHKPAQARTSSMYCLWGSIIVMVLLGGMLWLFPEFFVGLFIGQNVPELVGPTAGFLRVLALCLPALGASMTLMGVLRGSGDTGITAWISIISMYAFRLPLAFFLAFSDVGGSGLGLGWGLHGIWWAMTITVYIELILTLWRFLSGRWAQTKLHYE